MFDFWKTNKVPEFNEYFPALENMSHEQIKFYKTLKKSLDKNKYIEIDKNISYVFLYLYELLKKYNGQDFDVLYRKLIYFSELYKEDNKISEYCLFWAHDCLLGMGDLDGYLEKSEPKHLFGSAASQSDTRLNVQLHLERDANIIDLVLLRNGRKNVILCEHEAAYRDFLYEANE